MRALLDTQAFLWWITDDPCLPGHVRGLIGNAGNELFLSAASCWEISIKARLGKINLPKRPDGFISEQMAENDFKELPIHASHALHVYSLPLHHRDPFDRMLVAQSQVEGLPIITPDPLFAKYKVKTVWKEA